MLILKGTILIDSNIILTKHQTKKNSICFRFKQCDQLSEKCEPKPSPKYGVFTLPEFLISMELLFQSFKKMFERTGAM